MKQEDVALIAVCSVCFQVSTVLDPCLVGGGSVLAGALVISPLRGHSKGSTKAEQREN